MLGVSNALAPGMRNVETLGKLSSEEQRQKRGGALLGARQAKIRSSRCQREKETARRPVANGRHPGHEIASTTSERGFGGERGKEPENLEANKRKMIHRSFITGGRLEETKRRRARKNYF